MTPHYWEVGDGGGGGGWICRKRGGKLCLQMGQEDLKSCRVYCVFLFITVGLQHGVCK